MSAGAPGCARARRRAGTFAACQWVNRHGRRRGRGVGHRMWGRCRIAGAVVVVALLGGAPVASAHHGPPSPPPVPDAGPAADGPGALSHYDLARKDCVGTARNRTSKVWFTVADGVLSDVYFPTIDNTDVQSLQYVVTDGKTFTDLQERDTTYTVRAERTGMACTVAST